MKKICIPILCFLVSLQGFGQTPPTNPTAKILDKGTTLIVPIEIGWEWSYDLPYVGLGVWVGTGRGFDLGLQTAISFDLDIDYLEFIPTFYLRKSDYRQRKI